MGGDHDLMRYDLTSGARGITPRRRAKPSSALPHMDGLRFAIGTICEWWHYTLKGEPYPEQYFDFPIT